MYLGAYHIQLKTIRLARQSFEANRMAVERIGGSAHGGVTHGACACPLPS